MPRPLHRSTLWSMAATGAIFYCQDLPAPRLPRDGTRKHLLPTSFCEGRLTVVLGRTGRDKDPETLYQSCSGSPAPPLLPPPYFLFLPGMKKQVSANLLRVDIQKHLPMRTAFQSKELPGFAFQGLKTPGQGGGGKHYLTVIRQSTRKKAENTLRFLKTPGFYSLGPHGCHTPG